MSLLIDDIITKVMPSLFPLLIKEIKTKKIQQLI